MSDLLKEAIADAKAVRETALQNAKMALEEAFTPHLKSMLSAKLAEDDIEEGDFDEGYHDNAREEDDEEEDAEDMARMYRDDDEDDGGANVDIDIDADDDEEADESVSEEDIIEIDGVKYAPVVSEEEHEDEEEDVDESEELDLEAVIRELESELSEGEDDDEEGEEVEESTEEVEESAEEVEEEYEIDESALEEDEELDEVDKSSEIGGGDNKVGSTDTSSGIGKGDSKLSEVQEELKEYKEAVHFLKDKLHEVNILNAKLLFTNKLFKQYSLNNNQKLKVVETFDRAQTTREIKLVYSTLAEQFNDNGSIVTKKSISESASAPVSSTKPSTESRKVISEETQVANRFKKLAGLIK